MKTQLLTLGLLIGGCGSIDHLATSIDNASKTSSSTNTSTDTTNGVNPKTGSKTVSTTTTISESGDQSVFTDGQATTEASKPIVDSAIVGTWLEFCDGGIAYKKEFSSDGILTVTTYVFDNEPCDGKSPSEVFVQKRKYTMKNQDMIQIDNEAPITVDISGDNNTVIIGEEELVKK